MATITLIYSQKAADRAHSMGVRPASDDLLGFDTLAALVSATSQMPAIGADGVGGVMIGSFLNFTEFEDFATMTLSGVSVRGGGRVLATGLKGFHPGQSNFQQQGDYAMTVSATGGSMVVQSMSSTVNTASVETVRTPGMAGYDKVFGNMTGTLAGAMKTDISGLMSGSVTRLTLATQYIVKSALIEGQFSVSGHNGGLETSGTANLHGTLTTYRNVYDDGSIESIEGASIAYDSRVNSALLQSASNFSGDDVFNVSMPVLRDTLQIAAGEGNDVVTLAGGGGGLHVDAGWGNDIIKLASDTHFVEGGGGLDTVLLPGAAAEYAKGGSGGLKTFTDGGGAVASLSGIERVQFSDAGIAYDINGNAGQAYRMYKAAFDRAPDALGLGFWIANLDKGWTLARVASGFLGSDEYVGRYGADASDSAFIDNLYQNVLHRDPEAGAAAYWTTRLAAGASRAQVMVEFSESPENQAQVIGAIQNGIDYLPFG
ncbi:DUF4214 domain-containing protein [Massilia endophytica]|uniref:DUF4214 domain-containing protein n=1 Tax=Massilia endophytica TaxID=2899220 RepID=UPI001E338712|nr:DUF4214 domain-containing protein [Massilia endophytica]UGQ47090.1 DUF4214 domain-containing protein [Massilia endophytica]